MGKSKSQRRRQQRSKKRKADAVASSETKPPLVILPCDSMYQCQLSRTKRFPERQDAVASSEAKPLVILQCDPMYQCQLSRTNCYDDLKFQHLYPRFVPTLVPRFPERRETLSLDDGFAQTPDLKFISSFYDFEPSQHDIDMEISNLNIEVPISVNNSKLGVVYSEIAPSVVAVSAFYGVERKWESSGLVIHWNSTENEATILTSTNLLWNPKYSEFEFHLVVRMADGTLLLGKEDYVDYYHNLLTLKVKSMVELEVVDLRSRQANIVDDMHVIYLGRSFYTHSLYDFHGKLCPWMSPVFGCNELLPSACHIVRMCQGGPLVTDTGCVIGINFLSDYMTAHTLPTPIILSCLERWTSFRTVQQPWFGLSVIDVNRLSNLEREFSISTKEAYVVVKKVYRGSPAEKSKVCYHDSVATLNGTLIESTKQYYQLSSEASRCDSAQRLTVVIKRGFRTDLTIEADYISVDDKRFCDCWPRPSGDKWLQGLFRSGTNPRYCGMQRVEECRHMLNDYGFRSVEGRRGNCRCDWTARET